MSEFIEISNDESVNIASISRIERCGDETARIFIDGKAINTTIPYKVFTLVVKARSGNSEKYLKQLAEQSQTFRG